MKADARFRSQNMAFWASVRSISQGIGYTVRNTKKVRIPTEAEIGCLFHELQLDVTKLTSTVCHNGDSLLETLIDYFSYRANVLNTYVEPRLMDAERAKTVFEQLAAELNPSCPIPMNKQKGDKKSSAFLTGIVNMIVEANLEAGGTVDYDPRKLTTVTRDGLPLRTFSRRVDGAYPSALNPKAIWEIKEYYYTTTFGSRVADGVYETLLDGMEIEELMEHERVDIKHYLMVDAYYTWWNCGRSYLCRMIDMLNIGYVDEILFGHEVVERLPDIVRGWSVE